MDVAGLATGAVSLVSLFTTCLEIMDYVDAYRESNSDAQYVALEYRAEKLRLEDWGRAVGLERGALTAKHHPAFDDPRKLEAVGQVLLFIEGMCSPEGPASPHQRRLTRTLTGHGKRAREGENAEELTAMKSKMLESKRKKLKWVFRDKIKAEKQVTQLRTLVQSLHDLVPVWSAPKVEGKEMVESGGVGQVTGPGKRPGGIAQQLQFNGISEAEDSSATAPGSTWDLSRFGQMLQQMQQEFRAMNRKELIEWLKVDSEPIELYESLCRARLDTTCDWILKKPFFIDWAAIPETREAPKPRALWINGPAGFGKSTLCSRIIQHLLTGKTPVVHHFYSGKFAKREGPFFALRAWLGQLIGGDAALDVVQETWASDQKPSATLASVITMFQATVKVSDPFILVIDGLDECAPAASDGSGTLEEFFLLLGKTLGNTSCRLLITSRDEARIESAIQGVLEVETYHIGPDDVQGDTAAFAANVVERKLSKKPRDVQQEVSAKMSSLCGGQFLWLKMQAEQLRAGKNRHRLLTELENSPAGLDQLYDRYWEQIQVYEGYDRDRAVAMLRWAAFALQPLTISQLVGAVIVCDDDGEDLCLEDLPDELDEDYVQTEILELCGSLLEAQRPQEDTADIGSRSVQLTHFSVKEFLVRRFANYQNTEQAIDQHLLLARLCLRYILTPEVWESLSTSPMTDPFRYYAATTWYKHVQSAKKGAEAKVMDLTRTLFDVQLMPWQGWLKYVNSEATHEHNCTEHHKENMKRQGSPLYFAASFGFIQHVKYLLAEGRYDVNYRGSSGKTALHGACEAGHTELIKLLLEFGADITLRDCCEQSALHMAVKGQYVDILHVLLDEGADINAVNSHRETALYVAAIEGHLTPFTDLLKRGADISISRLICSDEPYPPFLAAVFGGHARIVEALLHHDGSLRGLTRDGWTPLAVALDNGRIDVAKVLIQDDPNISTGWSKGSAHVAFAAKSNNLEIFELLLKNGADPMAVGSDWRPLEFAVDSGNIEMTRRILEWAAHDAEDKDFGGTNGERFKSWLNSRKGKWISTCLYIAVQKKSLEIAKLLLQFGADPTISGTVSGWRPLHVASSDGDTDILRAMLHCWPPDRPISKVSSVVKDTDRETERWEEDHEQSSGTWVNVQIKEGVTALSQAIRGGHVEVVRLLVEAGADVSLRTQSLDLSPLMEACIYGHLEIIQILYDSGADLSRGNKGWSPASLAASHGRADVVQYLVQRGADITMRDSENDLSALMRACQYGHLEAAKVLLDSGDDPVATNKHGHSPVWYAAVGGNVDILRLLLGRGVDIHAREREHDCTVLMAACSLGHLEIVETLLDQGADIEAENDTGMTSYFAACLMKHFHVAELLLKAGAAGNTPFVTDMLSWAATGEVPLEAVQFLADHGADMNRPTDDKMGPLTRACYAGNIELVRLLLDHGADMNGPTDDEMGPLSRACYAGNIELVRLLLDHGADANGSEREKYPPFATACVSNLHVLSLVMEHGADPLKRIHYGISLLHIAVEHGGLDATLLACRYLEVERMVVDFAGRTAVTHAAILGREALADVLLRLRPQEEHAVDKWDSSLMDHAIRQGHVSLVEKLILRGTHEIKKSSLSRPTLWWARRSGNTQMVRLMEAFLGPESAEEEKQNQGVEGDKGPFGVFHKDVIIHLHRDERCDICGLHRLGEVDRVCKRCPDPFFICHRCYETGYRCFDDTHDVGLMSAEDIASQYKKSES